jgi:hypothetical protein
MALQQWALPQLSKLLPLDDDSLRQIVTYADTLSNAEAAEHFRNLLGDSPEALSFISSFNEHRSNNRGTMSSKADDGRDIKQNNQDGSTQGRSTQNQDLPAYAPPSYPPPSQRASKALIRPHTNQVIEAAHVRARDEVRQFFI